MIRKILTLIALAMALLIAVAVPTALAQGSATCVLVAVPTPGPTPDDAGDRAGDDAASAQESASVVPFKANVFRAADCASAAAYPGPFANVPAVPTGPYAAPPGLVATPQPDVTAAVAAPRTEPEPGSPLAHSGTETFVLAYLGTGLLAFGAVALGLRRRPASE